MVLENAGFVIYGAPMDQASFQTIKTGIRRGFSTISSMYAEETARLNLPEKFFCVVLSAWYFTHQAGNCLSGTMMQRHRK
mgnify:CR=1 FL=1